MHAERIRRRQMHAHLRWPSRVKVRPTIRIIADTGNPVAGS
jgi:hypothetical protein